MELQTLALAATILYASPPSAIAQTPPPPELKLLEDTIGTWDEVLTNKPTEVMPKAERSASITKKYYSLDGKFIRMEGTWNPAKLEFLSMLAYDPFTKNYRTWYFDSGGGMPRGNRNGSWDEKSRTMTWTGTDDFNNKTVGKTRIVDKNTHEWSLVVTDPNGKVLVDVQAKNTRRKE